MVKGWKDFCEHFRIPYTDRKDDIEIHCVLCGTSDRGRHLGLSKEGPFWGCWRNDKHRGSNPTKLIRSLLKINWDEAEILTRQFFGFTIPQGVPLDRKIFSAVDVPQEFRKFEEQTGELADKQKLFERYLAKRGLDALSCAERFDLRWCVDRVVLDKDQEAVDYSYRIIIPIKQNLDWFSWTARSLNPRDPVRYRAHDVAPNQFLFDQDWLTGGEKLIVTEGPFDAIKINGCYIPGVHATAVFGKVISSKQVNMLMELSEKYEIIVLAFDRDAYSDALRQANSLSLYIDNLRVRSPEDKDFGATSLDKLREEITSYN